MRCEPQEPFFEILVLLLRHVESLLEHFADFWHPEGCNKNLIPSHAGLLLAQRQSEGIFSGHSNIELFEIPIINRQVLAEHVVALLELKAENKRISIECSGLSNAPAVLGDPGRLEQVFVNLLDNAIKYTPTGGSVTLSAEALGDQVRIVKDTGTGIPSGDLPRIFERFCRVDSARSREEGGTGLGLAIVKHIVQLQGGTVSVESSGQGSSFYVTLKRA